MNVVLFDEEEVWKQLLPFTFTKPISELRLGIFTLREKWAAHLDYPCNSLSRDYLKEKYPAEIKADNFFINSKLLPDAALVEEIMALNGDSALVAGKTILAYRGQYRKPTETGTLKTINYSGEYNSIEQVWELFQKCGKGIEADIHLIAKKRKSQKLSATVTVLGDRNMVFLEEGAKAEACILNTTNGPIYIGREAEIMEGSVVRGPFALGEHSVLKLCSKIYGPTSIGPHCKVGGEVNNSVIMGYSNKAHDGFLGNSVLGEWCNLGADTNTSNLKNNYANVNLYSYKTNKLENTGLQFCGLMMGDHSKSGINTMFNTGTVVGVGCNIYGGGFPPTHIPSFSWGGSEGLQDYKLEKLVETAERVFERRGLQFGDVEKKLLQAVKEFKD